MSKWQIQHAKAKFSQVVDLANNDGPQTITRYDKPVAVLLSAADFELMAGGTHKVDVEAMERRLKKQFRGRKLKGNPVLEDRERD